MAGGMKVQFEFTAGDIAEVGSRTVDRSPLVRRWRRIGRWAWATLAGLLVFAVAPGEIGVRIAAGLLAAIALAAWFAWRGRRGNRSRRLVEFYRERLGGDGPFLCEVEIDATGVTARQLGAESRHPWPQVESISEAPGGIEFIYRPLGPCWSAIGRLPVRRRAPSSSHSRAAFSRGLRRLRASHLDARCCASSNSVLQE